MGGGREMLSPPRREGRERISLAADHDPNTLARPHGPGAGLGCGGVYDGVAVQHPDPPTTLAMAKLAA